ncbi:MAG: hypothetical protein RMZ43_021775 [Nostoc sp. CmiVER01]|uniref:hypothetical protein n=1 Tax=Nostoc sp. CmiVER01 TaxID=3075384 RepID=UPI002AD4D657|nr:hypothetical protein [Nostoc sp. CmiVER01]MDZ8126401.1 hypothetical protein [Nostoc sp. CmiVER01]
MRFNTEVITLLQARYRVLKQLGQDVGNTFEVDECGKTKVLKVLTENNLKLLGYKLIKYFIVVD